MLQGVGDLEVYSLSAFRDSMDITKIKKTPALDLAQHYLTAEDGCVQLNYSEKKWGLDLATGLFHILSREVMYRQYVTDGSSLD